MEPEVLQALLRASRRALQEGFEPEEILVQLHRRAPDLLRDVEDLAAARGVLARELAIPPEDRPAVEAGLREAERGRGPFGRFGRAAAEGMTFRFADELAGLGAALIPGGKDFEEAVTASRQSIEDLRTLEPTATTLSEIAGGVALPIGAGGGSAARAFISRGGNIAARAGRTLGLGGLFGAAEGAAFGAGEAEGGLVERAEEAGRGAVTGGLIGAGTAGVVGAIPGIGAGLGRLLRRELPGEAGVMRRIARDFKEQVGLSPQEMGGRLERIRKVAPEDVDVVLADLRPDVRRLATQAVETAPQTRAEGDVVQAIINRADSPAFAKAREAIESLEGFDDVDDALAALEALENFRRQSRQLAKMLEGATPRSPVEQQIPGGSSSIVAGALNAIKASQNLRRRVGERITRILLGDATEALKELDRLTRFTPGEQLARGARSLFDISSVGGIAAQAGPGTEGLFGR